MPHTMLVLSYGIKWKKKNKKESNHRDIREAFFCWPFTLYCENTHMNFQCGKIFFVFFSTLRLEFQLSIEQNLMKVFHSSFSYFGRRLIFEKSVLYSIVWIVLSSEWRSLKELLLTKISSSVLVHELIRYLFIFTTKNVIQSEDTLS